MPFVKTGGLADVLGSLPSAIQRLGHDVTVFLPRYKAVDFREWELEVVVNRLEVKIGSEQETGRVYQLTAEKGPKIYFIDQPEFSFFFYLYQPIVKVFSRFKITFVQDISIFRDYGFKRVFL